MGTGGFKEEPWRIALAEALPRVSPKYVCVTELTNAILLAHSEILCRVWKIATSVFWGTSPYGADNLHILPRGAADALVSLREVNSSNHYGGFGVIPHLVGWTEVCIRCGYHGGPPSKTTSRSPYVDVPCIPKSGYISLSERGIEPREPKYIIDRLIHG